MSRKITIVKQELVWLSHEDSWEEADFNEWKEYLFSFERNLNLVNNKSVWATSKRVLADMVRNMTWDEAAVRFYQGNDITVELKDDEFNYTISFLDELRDAMSEDAWEADYEIGDCLDSDGYYDYEGFDDVKPNDDEDAE